MISSHFNSWADFSGESLESQIRGNWDQADTLVAAANAREDFGGVVGGSYLVMYGLLLTAAVSDTGEGGTWALTKCDPNNYMPCEQLGRANSIRNGAAPQFTLIGQAILEFDRDGDGFWSASERAACPWSHSNVFRRLRLIGNVSEIAAEVNASGLLSERCVE